MEDCMINPPEDFDYGYPEPDECPGCGAQTPARCRCGVSPFREDLAVCQLAEEIGMEVSRYECVEISDADAKAAGMMRQCPDYARIRKALRDGTEVPGAKLLPGVEYKLRRLPTGGMVSE